MKLIAGCGMGAVAMVGMFGAWQLLAQLSPDAIGMIVGLLFGTLAGVPVTLLLLYGRREERPFEQPRVIVVHGPAALLAQPEAGEYVDVQPVRSRRLIVAK